MDTRFKGVIWTNHALDRMRKRGIKQGDAWAAWRRPDQSRYTASKSTWVYYKTYGDTKIEVVAKQNERKEWIILSVWSRPVYEKSGTLPTKPAPLWKQVIKQLLGIRS